MDNTLNYNLLILGNGFDLNLGYPTSYEDFFYNDALIGQGSFPFVKNGCDFGPLGEFILSHFVLDSWFSLEELLSEYGKSPECIEKQDCQRHRSISHSRDDKEDYDNLVSSFTKYLVSCDFSNPDISSVAAQIIKAVHSDPLFPPKIYSFNYTELDGLYAALGISGMKVEHVHGSILNGDIIFGVGDYTNLRETDDFMYKTSNPKYRSTSLVDDITSFDNIIIFGLSLSQVDYPYFEDFFKKVSKNEVGKKYIRIITYDDNSRTDILRNLRRMNQGMIKLWNYSNFDIVCTKDNVDEKKVSEILEHLSTLHYSIG